MSIFMHHLNGSLTMILNRDETAAWAIHSGWLGSVLAGRLVRVEWDWEGDISYLLIDTLKYKISVSKEEIAAISRSAMLGKRINHPALKKMEKILEDWQSRGTLEQPRKQLPEGMNDDQD